MAFVSSDDNGTDALIPATYCPGARPSGTWTVNDTSLCCAGSSVIWGADTTIQREVNAFALPGWASCMPVVGAVLASTPSSMTVTW